jgi:hypothetical protein
MPHKSREAKNRRYRELQAARRGKGLCLKCGRSTPNGGEFTRCDRCRASSLRAQQAHRERAWQTVLDYYGRACECCLEADPDFLTIDHVDRDGAKHRREGVRGGKEFARWLVRNGFPGGFRLLCFNCNIGRERNGGVCPHVTEQVLGMAA